MKYREQKKLQELIEEAEDYRIKPQYRLDKLITALKDFLVKNPPVDVGLDSESEKNKNE